MAGADIAAIIMAAAALISAATAAWKSFRARQFNAAFSESEQALKSVVAAIEVWGRAHPNDPRIETLKSYIQALATATGSEDGKLKDAVAKTVQMLDDSGVFVDASHDGQMHRAAEAVKASSPEMPKKKRPEKTDAEIVF